MRKLLFVLLALTFVIAVFAPVAFADSDKEKDNGKNSEAWQEKKDEQEAKKEEQEAKKEEQQAQVEERKEEQAQLKEEFTERMMERAELKDATKEQLKEQRELVLEYKNQLKLLKEELEGLTEEERLLYADEIEALMLQIRQAHKNQLEIMKASKDEIKEILPGVRVGNPPSEEEVEEVIEEVLGDLV